MKNNRWSIGDTISDGTTTLVVQDVGDEGVYTGINPFSKQQCKIKDSSNVKRSFSERKVIYLQPK